MTAINRDEWLSALSEAGYSHEDDQNAVTIDEFAAMLNIKRAAAQDRLSALVTAGRATQTHKFATHPGGRRIRYIAYRLVK